MNVSISLGDIDDFKEAEILASDLVSEIAHKYSYKMSVLKNFEDKSVVILCENLYGGVNNENISKLH